nr:hypothetical protein [Tanacetum cinerariifolium]
ITVLLASRPATSTTSYNHYPPPAFNYTSEPPPRGKLSLDSRHMSENETHMTHHHVTLASQRVRMGCHVSPPEWVHVAFDVAMGKFSKQAEAVLEPATSRVKDRRVAPFSSCAGVSFVNTYTRFFT